MYSKLNFSTLIQGPKAETDQQIIIIIGFHTFLPNIFISKEIKTNILTKQLQVSRCKLYIFQLDILYLMIYLDLALDWRKV